MATTVPVPGPGAAPAPLPGMAVGESGAAEDAGHAAARHAMVGGSPHGAAALVGGVCLLAFFCLRMVRPDDDGTPADDEAAEAAHRAGRAAWRRVE